MTRSTPFSKKDVFESKCWAPFELESMENEDACAPKEEDEKTIMENFRRDTKESEEDAEMILSNYRLQYEAEESQKSQADGTLSENSAQAVDPPKKEMNQSTPESIGEEETSLKCLTYSLKRSSERLRHKKEHNASIKQYSKCHVKAPTCNKSQANQREHKIKRIFNNRQRIRITENIFENRCFQSKNASFCRKPISKKRDNWLHKIFLFLILLQVTTAQENPVTSSDHDNESNTLRLNITSPGTLEITWGNKGIHVHHTPGSISARAPNSEACWQEQDKEDFEMLDMVLLFGLFILYNVTLYSRDFCRVTVKHKDQLLFSIVVTKDTTVDTIFRRVQHSQGSPGSRALEGYFRSRNCPFLSPKKVMHDILEPVGTIDVCLVFIEAT